MSDQLETSWRKVHEFRPAVVWTASTISMPLMVVFSRLPKAPMLYMTMVSLMFAAWCWWGTVRLWNRKIALAGRPMVFLPASALKKYIIKKPDYMWMGKGFDWKQEHTQRVVELRQLDIDEQLPPEWFLKLRKTPVRDGKFPGKQWIHGVGGEKDKDVLIPYESLEGHTIVFGTTGAGKAQPLYARVHTPQGWKRMGELKVGAYVSTPDGKAAQIDGVFPQGSIPVYKITFVDGRIVEACGNHLWEIHHKHWNGKYKKGASRTGKAVPRILSTLELQAQIQRSKGVFSVRLTQPVDKPAARLPIDPYVLGCFLGDGLLGKGTRLTFCNEALDVVARIRARLPETMELVDSGPRPIDYSLLSTGQTARGGKLADGTYTAHPYRKAFRELGLGECRSWEKFIPQLYKDASIEQRLEVLRGLMDTDGEVGKNRGVYFTSTSERLAKDVQELIWSLGGIAKITQKQTHFTGTDGQRKAGRLAYRVAIRHPQAHTLLTHEKRLARLAGEYQYADSLKLAVKSIEYSHDTEAQCISVNHPEHLYITDGYVVTHNTRMMETMIYQSVMRGETVIIIDPKGDRELREITKNACIAAGRPEAYLFFHPAFPSQSIRLDPLKNWSRVTSVASRISALLAGGDGGGDTFVQFAWRAVNLVTEGYVYVEERPTLAKIRSAVESDAARFNLMERVLKVYFKRNIENWEMLVGQYVQEARAGKSPLKLSAAATNELRGYIAYYNKEVRPEQRSPEVDGLLSMVTHDVTHYSKMIQTILPLLASLTSGDLGKLLSPDASDINDTRPIFDSDKIIKGRHVFYIGLDSLSDPTVGSAIGSIAIADIVAVAGHIYNYGEKERISMYVDEASEAVNVPMIQGLNKGRGAGMRVTLFAQTLPDFVVKLGDADKARMLLGNCNNLIALRTKDRNTQDYITETFGETFVNLRRTGHTTGSRTEDAGLMISGSITEGIAQQASAVFPPELLGMLPNLQYIAMISGGRLVKGRLPILRK